MRQQAARFHAGVDGGGTNCRLRLRDRDGRLLAEGRGGSANLYSSLESTQASILAAAESAFSEAGLSSAHFAETSIGLGLAGGLGSGASRALVDSLPFASAAVFTDAEAALAGAFLGGDGAIAIFGTGSAYLARRGGKLVKLGGWGFPAGDEASGADLGRQAIRRTLHAVDGLCTASGLTQAVLARFGGDPLAIIAFARDSKPAAYATLAPMVFAAAEAGDAVALAILAEAVRMIEASLAVLMDGISGLCLIGGLSDLYAQRLSPNWRSALQRPAADAMDGAILLTGGRIA